jgi:type IX secretion system PorP/SprF family membrane protein
LRTNKLILVFILLGVMLLEAKSVLAQDPEFTQFYANPLYLNPAFAGTHRCPRVALNYRNQWPGLTGSFVTTSASYDQHVDAIYGGLGLLVVNDVAANTLTTSRISGMYSYEGKVSRTFSIRAGVEATYFQKTLDWSKLTFGDMIDARRGFVYDTYDIQRGGQRSGMDFSAGLLGYSDKFFFGLAVHHLTEPNESLISGNSPLPRKFTGHAGANIVPQGSGGKYVKSDVVISPNILFRAQENFSQLNLGLYISKGSLVGGAWYRNRDAFILLLGIKSDMVSLGYSYDVTVSKLSMAIAGSHEISFTLNFNCKPKKRTYRTISCPSF